MPQDDLISKLLEDLFCMIYYFFEQNIAFIIMLIIDNNMGRELIISY